MNKKKLLIRDRIYTWIFWGLLSAATYWLGFFMGQWADHKQCHHNTDCRDK